MYSREKNVQEKKNVRQLVILFWFLFEKVMFTEKKNQTV